MPQFRVRVERVDTYSRTLDVTAPNKAAAQADVEARLADAGWEGAFPDNDEGEYEECQSSVAAVERLKPNPAAGTAKPKRRGL